MIKLNPIKSEKIWGYENWIASTHKNGLQKEFVDFAGDDYPLLVKVIQANDVLSVQVHPDDEKAALFENCRGKTECWYVLSADEGAKIIYGMKKDYPADEIRRAVEESNLEEYLEYVAVKAGDFVFIPAGTVHAIGGGLRLLEVQQSSDVTYRLYDWGRGRECHIEKAVACINECKDFPVGRFPERFTCEYFFMEEFEASDRSFPVDAMTELYFVLAGNGSVNGLPACVEDIFAFRKGECLEVKGSLRLMKIIPR